jgi:L-lactate dehydrogenase complex protein LldG
MSDTARERIFAKLRSAVQAGEFDIPSVELLPRTPWGRPEKVLKLKTLMETMRSEVHLVKADSWTDELRAVLKKRNLKTLLHAPETPVGAAVKQAWEASDGKGLPALRTYDGNIEDFKHALFHEIDAGITSTLGGIAESGALILWPTADEPRLMSLIPPIHIAVLEAEKIYDTFSEAIEKMAWPDRMPTNALLISGPSKTADIEMTLAFGVHGPKELIVFILEP